MRKSKNSYEDKNEKRKKENLFEKKERNIMRRKKEKFWKERKNSVKR